MKSSIKIVLLFLYLAGRLWRLTNNEVASLCFVSDSGLNPHCWVLTVLSVLGQLFCC